jgi:hypothetical protein
MGRANDECRFITSPPHRVLRYCWCCLYCVYCCGRLERSDGRVLLLLLVLHYCCGRLKLSDGRVMLVLLYCRGRLKLSDDRVLLLLLYCRGCWYGFTAVVVSSCPTTTPSGYCCGRLKLSDGRVLLLLVLLWPSQAVRRPGTFTAGVAVAVSSCPTAGYFYCWCCLYCCGRLKLSDDRVLLLLLYCRGCWYCCTAGVAGIALLLWSSHAVRRPRPPATAVLLWSSQAVRRPRPPGTALLLVLPVLLRPSQAVQRPGTAVRVSRKRKQLQLPQSGGKSFFSPHDKNYKAASWENQILKFSWGGLAGVDTKLSELGGVARRRGCLGVTSQ